MAVAGQGGTFAEPRFKAAIAMSTPAPRQKDYDRVYGSVHIPILHMTGTEDDSPVGETKAAERPKDPLFHSLILQGTTAFWDAYLKGDAAAKDWLAKGGYAAVLGADGKLEEKLR